MRLESPSRNRKEKIDGNYQNEIGRYEESG